MTDVLEQLKGRLVVSCQAYPGEPMRHPETMVQIAQASVTGGAAAVRLQGLADIRLAVARLDVPVIGLIKDGSEGVFITPTLEHALAVAATGAQVVALDGTRRPRPDGLSLAQTLGRLRAEHEVLVMADCDTVESAVAAVEAGADLVGTTLAGFTADRAKTDGPDLELLAQIVDRLPGVPVVAEGRIHTPQHAAAARAAGAWAVVVGTAITHPSTITGWFATAVEEVS